MVPSNSKFGEFPYNVSFTMKLMLVLAGWILAIFRIGFLGDRKL